MLKTQNYYELKNEKIHISSYLLALYLFILPLDFIDIGLGSILKIFSVLVIAFTILNHAKEFKFKIDLSIIMLIYCVFNYISSAYSVNTYVSTSRAQSLILNYAFIIVCSGVHRNNKELDILKKSLALSGWFVVGLMIYFNGNLAGAEGRLVVMVDGQYQDPNYMCGYMLFSIAYYLDIIFNKEHKVWAIISILTMFVFVIATGSRGGTLAIISVCIFFYLLDNTNKHKVRNVFIILFVGIIVLLIVNHYLSEDILMRFTKEFNETNQGAGRFELWESAIYHYSNFGIFNKFFGSGAGTIRNYTINVAHNIWIETLVELGIIGLIMLTIMYVLFIIYGFKLKSKVYMATLLGYIVMTMSLSLYTYKPIFTMFMFISMFYKYEYLDKG